MTTDTSAEALELSIHWLQAKYRRHGEIEDRIAAEQLEYFQAEKRRTREGVTDEMVDRCAKIILSEDATPEAQPTFYRDIRAALEAVWPDGRDAKDAARYRWLRSCGAAAEELAICTDYGWVAGSDFDETIDAAMKDTDHD